MVINKKYLFLCLLLFPLLGFSQTGKKLKKEDNSPKVSFWEVVGDSLTPLKYLNKKADQQKKGQYLVTPIHDKPCEIIVDIETFENYYGVQTLHREGKKPKQIVKTFPPKRYMLGYERFEVK